MIDNVIGFPKATGVDSGGITGAASLSGIAICGKCQHEWAAIAPVEATHLECPNCRTFWGAMKHAVEPETAWRCNCGEYLFWLTPTGALCRRCGSRSNDWAKP